MSTLHLSSMFYFPLIFSRLSRLYVTCFALGEIYLVFRRNFLLALSGNIFPFLILYGSVLPFPIAHTNFLVHYLFCCPNAVFHLMSCTGCIEAELKS